MPFFRKLLLKCACTNKTIDKSKYFNFATAMFSFSNPHISIALPADVTAITVLLNSAYRGEGSKQGWTTEAHLIAGAVAHPVQRAALAAFPVEFAGDRMIRANEHPSPWCARSRRRAAG